MSDFTPELGQFGFSNTPWQEIDSPHWMESGLEIIAEAIRIKRDDGDGWNSLTSNSGADPYESAVFAMRSYCWCEGEGEHENGCPPNFEHRASGLIVNWYKHSGRGRSQNKMVSQKDWFRIVQECLADVDV